MLWRKSVETSNPVRAEALGEAFAPHPQGRLLLTRLTLEVESYDVGVLEERREDLAPARRPEDREGRFAKGHGQMGQATIVADDVTRLLDQCGSVGERELADKILDMAGHGGGAIESLGAVAGKVPRFAGVPEARPKGPPDGGWENDPIGKIEIARYTDDRNIVEVSGQRAVVQPLANGQLLLSPWDEDDRPVRDFIEAPPRGSTGRLPDWWECPA